MNKTPTVVVHGMMSEEKYTSRKPNILHLKVVDCIAYVHVPNEKRTKLDAKAKNHIFIGYYLPSKRVLLL